jgi:hypothetical protein
MKYYHVTVNDRKTCEIVFEFQVPANNSGEAMTKTRNYLVSKGHEITDLAHVLVTREIGFPGMTGIPLLNDC